MARKRNNGADDSPRIGSNSNLNQDEKIKLSGFISEIERVDADARETASERGTIYKAAKEQGFDTKALKHVIRMRRMEKNKRAEFETYVDAYTVALGDFVTTPLGQAGLDRVKGGDEAH